MTLAQFYRELAATPGKWAFIGGNTLRLAGDDPLYRNYCPITAVTKRLLGSDHPVTSYSQAAHELGLTPNHVNLIVRAADGMLRNPSVRRVRHRLRKAVGL